MATKLSGGNIVIRIPDVGCAIHDLTSKGGGQKKTKKKSCNIVTTHVRLPTYPYCYKEGNFFFDALK